MKLSKMHSGEYFDTINDRKVWNLNILWIVITTLAVEGYEDKSNGKEFWF